MKSAGELLSGMTAYQKLLADKRWKEFGKEYRSLVGEYCHHCKSAEGPLQIHHLFYDGRKPWEYDYGDVILLCGKCHSEIHEELKRFRRYVFGSLKGLQFSHLNDVLFHAIKHREYSLQEFVHAIDEMATSPRSVKMFAYSFEGRKSRDSEKATR